MGCLHGEVLISNFQMDTFAGVERNLPCFSKVSKSSCKSLLSSEVLIVL